MNNYTIKFTLNSSFITPFHSDTIWGHICWALLYTYSESELKKFLRAYSEDEPPLIQSNAFPKGLLPCPSLPPLTKKELFELSKKFFDEDCLIEGIYEIRSLQRRLDYLPKDVFTMNNANALNYKKIIEQVWPWRGAFPFEPTSHTSVYHAKIDRLSGTTYENSLFTTEECYSGSREYEAYCRVRPDFYDKLLNCLKFIEETGFGKKKSSGKGDVASTLVDAADFSSEGANAFMSLSNYVPKRNDPIKGYHRTLTKYGKLGGHFASSPYSTNGAHLPFKYPVVMFQAGSVFLTESHFSFYGRVIDKVHPATDMDIKQYGIAYPLPVLAVT